MSHYGDCKECQEPRATCPDCKRPIANKHDEGIHNTGNCGCKEARALCWREWSPDGLCRELSVYDPDHDEETNRPVPRTAVIDFVKGLTRGPCGCQYNMGSCSIGTYDPYTGKSTPGHYDRGPRTHHCIRCRAREALERDNIPYEKDDRAFWPLLEMGVKLKVDCEPMMGLGGQTFVTSGSITLSGYDPDNMRRV